MHIRQLSPSRTSRRVLASVGIVGLALSAAACGSDDDNGSGSPGAAGDTEKIGVALITKDSSNPFFVAMQKGAQADADKNNVDLTIASGKQEGDDAGQIAAIEQAVVRGDKGILITPMSTGVNDAITKARDAGLYVIALDTPPDPAETVDITFATDNREAGRLIGQWAAATLDGGQATIALLDLFNDKIVSVDYDRDQGFLEGMGIDVADPKKNGDEAATGKYTGGKGGDYTIVCNEPSNGSEDLGRTAMETCLTKSDGINVVYTINEPAAVGASAALKAAGKSPTRSSCRSTAAAPASSPSRTGHRCHGPAVPAEDGDARHGGHRQDRAWRREADHQRGSRLLQHGVALVTDKPAEGVESITTDEALKICWG